MNKFTWMIIALALAIAAGFLIKDSANDPIIMQLINYSRTPKTAEVTTGDVVVDPAAEVATGNDANVVDPAAEAATGNDANVVDPAAAEAATGNDADVVDPTAEAGVDTVVVDPSVEVMATGTAQ